MIALVLTLALAAPVPADKAKAEKAEYTVHGNYFEKNNAGLKGDASYLLLTDQTAFDKVFGTGFVMGYKPVVLPKEAFDTKVVAAVIHRGNTITTYEVTGVTTDGVTLTVEYKATAGPAGTATFASPLVVSVDKRAIAKVVFVENGKEAGTAGAK